MFSQASHAISRQKNLYFPLPQESMRTTFHYPESPYGRTYADVITKISRMDGLPNYLRYGAPLAGASRARSSAITRWREDMNFIFWWQNNILRTSVASE